MPLLWWVDTSFIIYRWSRYLYQGFKKEIYYCLKSIGIARKHFWIRKINIFINVNWRLVIRNKTERRKREYFIIIKIRLWKWFEGERKRIWAENVGFIKETFFLVKKS
jgi:hypothetical protein